MMKTDLEKLRILQQELIGLREQGLLNTERFEAVLEQATLLCQQSPRMLEGFIKLAPSDWVHSRLSAMTQTPALTLNAAVKSKKISTPSPA
jgi:hypothetical protein